MKDFYIITNEQKDADLKVTKQMQTYIRKRGGDCGYALNRSQGKDGSENLKPEAIPETVECVFCVGGDGTLIRAARDLVERKIPVIGVNQGHIGYLCELDSNTVFSAIDQLMAGNYMVEKRMLLSGYCVTGRKRRGEYQTDACGIHRSAPGEQEKSLADTCGICGSTPGEQEKSPADTCGIRHSSHLALNDIVIHRSGFLQVVNVIISVNGEYLNTYSADGIIIATPTGSTAYSMSAGGPIVDPKAELILITPISPHALNSKSIVLGAEDEITVEIGSRRPEEDEEAEVSFDGDLSFRLAVGDRIVIRRAGESMRILKLSRLSFLENLRKKMQEYT